MSELIAIISSLTGLFIAGASTAFWAITKFNDMAHIQASLERIEKKQEDIGNKFEQTSERIAKIEGKCLVNHGI